MPDIRRMLNELETQKAAKIRQVEIEHEEKVKLVRAMCRHEYPKSLWLHDCIHCGQTKPLGIQSVEPLVITDEQIEKLQDSLNTMREQQKIEQWS